MKKGLRFLLSLVLLLSALELTAQPVADRSKMSPLVRRLSRGVETSMAKGREPMRSADRAVCAFVLVGDDGGAVLEAHGCRSLAQFGAIHIAEIPLERLNDLSLDGRVLRIEANQSNALHMNKVAGQVNATPVLSGQGLPQAYTGKGVVMGVMDVGFDLTHPNFFDASGSEYRVRAFWDQLSADSLYSDLYVGADYVGQEALLGYAHSRDGLLLTHGTHTLGCAAGSGANTPYRGVAPESDICIVSNAVSSDLPFIAEEDRYKYTYATDALGFKYIFDYAEAHGKPCVISFSEGSEQDFRGYDILYEAVLDSLTQKPGRIIVSSAGNDGWHKTYFRKPAGTESAGSFVTFSGHQVAFTLKAENPFQLRLKSYQEGAVADWQVALPDGLDEEGCFAESVTLGAHECMIDVEGFPSCYDNTEMAYEITLTAEGDIGKSIPFSLETVGVDADVEFYLSAGELEENVLDASLCAGEATHSINSPACSKSVVCVGGTTYSTGITNYLGEEIASDWGPIGLRGSYSSVGPTYDGRMKPDVMAPGIDVVSSLSSYYIEGTPDGSSVHTCVEMFDHGGRQYGWTALSGTSMSAPVVGGAVALWLQANPTLTREDVMEIIKETSTHPEPSLSYPNNYYGYGQIDVYKGLLYALDLVGIEGLSLEQPRKAHIGIGPERQVVITFDTPVSDVFKVKMFDLRGCCLGEQTFPAGQQRYEFLPKTDEHGVYAVQIDSQSAAQRGSTLVRL